MPHNPLVLDALLKDFVPPITSQEGNGATNRTTPYAPAPVCAPSAPTRPQGQGRENDMQPIENIELPLRPQRPCEKNTAVHFQDGDALFAQGIDFFLEALDLLEEAHFREAGYDPQKRAQSLLVALHDARCLWREKPQRLSLFVEKERAYLTRLAQNTNPLSQH